MKLPDGAELGEWNMLCRLLRNVSQFAGRDFQSRVWLRGEGTEVTSYTEAMLVVLEDAETAFGDDAYRYRMTAEQVTPLRAFRDKLELFENRVHGGLGTGDDSVIVADPNGTV